MSFSARLERLAIHCLILGYILFVLFPWLIFFSLGWLAPLLFLAGGVFSIFKGGRVDRLLDRLWARADTPNKKAALYFGSAFGPLLWLPLEGLKASLSVSLFLFGLFLVPPCLKVMNRLHLAALTLGLAAALAAFWIPFGRPGTLGMLVSLPIFAMLLILLPYAIFVLLPVQAPLYIVTFLMTRMSLISAVESGNVHFVRRLLDAGKDVDSKLGDETALHWAAQLGKTEVAALLLDRGALIDPKNGADQTPLILAARGGRAGIVRLLIENGAELDATDIRGETALDQAKSLGHREITDILEKAKKDRA